MNDRRRFSSRERVALYLAADGKCSRCGKELEPGWHGDHVTPWSRGGQTDVTNGQALCPACNEKKGDKMTELRPWQAGAFSRFLAKGPGNFLVVATPGAGKTLLALASAQRLMEMGESRRIIVVVPTSHLRRQWALAASEHGIQLDYRFENGSGALGADYDGVACTYAAVASAPLIYRRLSTGALVVLDEVHHGGDERPWGKALTTAFESAARRLLLSGTPGRTDGKAVPFVEYDNRGNFVADVIYDYGEALQDGVVRPIAFLALDGQMQWRSAGEARVVALVDAEGDDMPAALSTALDPDGDWIPSVLRRADDELTQHRSVVPDAGGLIVAATQMHARAYASMLRRISGEQPVVATSDEPDASDRISDFARGTQRWLVAVQMVSEGVDIKRLTVGVYASRARTELFFRQVVGRFVRMRDPDDPITSTLLIPAIEPLVRYSRAIETTVTHALNEEEEHLRREMKDRGEQMQINLVEPMSSSEAQHHETILAGESFSELELARAGELCLRAGMNAVSPAQVALLLRLAGEGRIVGTATIDVPPPRPLADDKAQLRRLLSRRVSQLNKITGEEYSHIWHRLNEATDNLSVKRATAAMLERRLDLVDCWIQDAGVNDY